MELPLRVCNFFNTYLVLFSLLNTVRLFLFFSSISCSAFLAVCALSLSLSFAFFILTLSSVWVSRYECVCVWFYCCCCDCIELRLVFHSISSLTLDSLANALEQCLKRGSVAIFILLNELQAYIESCAFMCVRVWVCVLENSFSFQFLAMQHNFYPFAFDFHLLSVTKKERDFTKERAKRTFPIGLDINCNFAV